ncbi:MAG: hypothetical protein Q9195_000872 [Heterodermia aff. obscurata]
MGQAPAQSGFYLPDLPIELQQVVLRKCLVTPLAMFNFGISRKKKHLSPPAYPDAIDELFGQDELNVAILFTCRLYNKEAWKMLFSENTFSFDVELSRWQEVVASDILELWLSGSRNITILNLRVISLSNTSDTIRLLQDRVRALKDFPSLRVFKLDFIAILPSYLPFAHEDYSDDEHLDESIRMAAELFNIKHILQGELRTRAVDRCASLRSIMLGQAEHRLEKVILTGLLDNDLHLLMIKFVSLLVKPSGYLEIANGVGGKEYKFCRFAGNIVRIGEPKRFILPLEELQAWIQTNRSPQSFDWARPFKWEDFEETAMTVGR